MSWRGKEVINDNQNVDMFYHGPYETFQYIYFLCQERINEWGTLNTLVTWDWHPLMAPGNHWLFGLKYWEHDINNWFHELFEWFHDINAWLNPLFKKPIRWSKKTILLPWPGSSGVYVPPLPLEACWGPGATPKKGVTENTMVYCLTPIPERSHPGVRDLSPWAINIVYKLLSSL